MSEKIYCGSGKIITTNFGPLTKISFTEKDVETLQGNLSNGWVNLVLKEKKNKVDGKPTHYLEVDTWKPKKMDVASPQPQKQEEKDELPF